MSRVSSQHACWNTEWKSSLFGDRNGKLSNLTISTELGKRCLLNRLSLLLPLPRTLSAGKDVMRCVWMEKDLKSLMATWSKSLNFHPCTFQDRNVKGLPVQRGGCTPATQKRKRGSAWLYLKPVSPHLVRCSEWGTSTCCLWLLFTDCLNKCLPVPTH